MEVNSMFTRKFAELAIATSLLIAASTMVFAGQGAMGAQEKEQTPIKKVPMVQSKIESGAQMFKDYCAVCHGMDGKGDGPAMEYLKAPPPSLRTLARRNDGKYPDTKVISVLQLGTSSKAHGTSDMPVWGPMFREHDGNVSVLRIHNLTEYIKTLQDK
jgi:mono/diheme cytochrome c family protein